MNETADPFDALTQFDGSYNPQGNGEFSSRPDLSTLQDGEYDFRVTDAKIKTTQKQQIPILEVGIFCEQNGNTIGWAVFMKTQQNVDILGADLCRLGFEDDIGPGRQFSAGLRAVLPKMVGIRFHAKKVKTDSGFHNLQIRSKLANSGTVPMQAPVYATGDPNEIPF